MSLSGLSLLIMALRTEPSSPLSSDSSPASSTQFLQRGSFPGDRSDYLAPLRIEMYCKSSRKNSTFSHVSHQYTVGIESSTIDQTCMKFVDYRDGAYWYGAQWYVAYPSTYSGLMQLFS